MIDTTLGTQYMEGEHSYRFVLKLLLAMAVSLPTLAGGGNQPKGINKADPNKTEQALHGNYDYILSSEAQSGSIPFSKAGNLIIIQANVDTVSGNFILDTGAPGLILNATYFRDMKTIKSSASEVAGLTGAIQSYQRTEAEKLMIGDFEYYRVQADRANLGHIENSKGIKILGLLGVHLFKRFEMVIDFENNLIHLHKIGKKEKAAFYFEGLQEWDKYDLVPIQVLESKMLIPLFFGKRKLNFILDTGAESNVLDSRLPNQVLDSVKLERKITVIGSGNEKRDAWYGNFTGLRAGEKPLQAVEVLLTSLAQMSMAYDRNIDGMLGIAFLSQQKIGINFQTEKLYIWK